MTSPSGPEGEEHRSVTLLDRYFSHIRDVIRLGREYDQLSSLKTAARAWMILRAFYAYLLFLSFPKFSRASEFWVLGKARAPKLHLELPALIPVDLWAATGLIAATCMLVASLLLAFSPHHRWLRLLAALGFVLVLAIDSDQRGKINHGNHAALWIAIGAVFLPSRAGHSRTDRENFLSAFFGLQLLVGMLYSCAGVCKLLGVLYDWPEGVTWFHPDALPLTIAGNWHRSKTTVLGGFLLAQPLIASSGQIAAFLLELLALPAVFMRQLQRPWALGLALLHAMILASMRIHFHEACIILLLFLGASPFASSARETLLWLRRAPRYPSRKEATGRPGVVARRAPALDGSARWARLWSPALITVYVFLAFFRFDARSGRFGQELFPFSPLPMFYRVHSEKRVYRKLEKLRRRIESRGYFPERTSRSSRRNDR